MPGELGRDATGLIYLCTPLRPDLGDFVRACLDGGVDLIQVRDKAASDRDIVAAAESIREDVRRAGAWLFINDRIDLALAVEADGVHVGQEDLPPSIVRAIARNAGASRLMVGLSTHSVAQVDAAQAEPIDYFSVGPVVPTPTKQGRPGIGLDPIRHAALHARLPFFVTGGVTPERIPELWGAGARNFVVVRYLTEARDPFEAARSLKEEIDRLMARS
jgi:thiamine-phosphate pyrophosphorylase